MTTKGKETDLRRRHLLQALTAAAVGVPLNPKLSAQAKSRISVPILRNAEVILGESYSEERLQAIEVALQRNLDQFESVRCFEVDDLVEPAPMFLTQRYATDAAWHRASATDGESDHEGEVSRG